MTIQGFRTTECLIINVWLRSNLVHEAESHIQRIILQNTVHLKKSRRGNRYKVNSMNLLNTV